MEILIINHYYIILLLMSNEKVGRLFTGTLFTILISHTRTDLTA